MDYLVMGVVAYGAYTDGKDGLIRNTLTLPLLVGAMIFQIATGHWQTGIISLVLSCIILVPMYLLGALGGGDVKLLSGLAVYFGPERWVILLLIAVVVSVLWELVRCVRFGIVKQWAEDSWNRLRRKEGHQDQRNWERPMGQYIAIGTLVTVAAPFITK